jgi:prepilin-type N-terminal cleavage/methylation domain-containing protein
MPRQIVPKHRGFTVLEITVAVAIIAILSALLVYGISHLTASAKANQTKIMLQNNRGMLQEFDTAAGLSRSVNFWPWIDLETGNVYIAFANPGYLPTLPFPNPTLWSSSVVYKSTVNGNTIYPAGPLCAPIGPMTNDAAGFQNRNGSYAVLYTQLAMRMIGGVSAAKPMLAAIPSGSTMVPVWISGAPYAPGNVVKSPVDNSYYRCITLATAVWTGTMMQPNFGSSYSTDPSGDLTNWAKLGPNETPDPVLLDAWGNPILMAPAAGLINVWTNCTNSAALLNQSPPQWGGSVTPTTQLQAWAYPVPSSEAPGQTYFQKPIVAPDNKPFFYSAGPDGLYNAGDDNIYSFD